MDRAPKSTPFPRTSYTSPSPPTPITPEQAVSQWTLQPGLPTSNWARVAWSPELNLFVTGNGSGLSAYSNDGITWTTNSNLTGNATVIWCKEIGLFIYGTISFTGQPARFFISSDGITWSIISTSFVGRGTSGTGLAFNGSVAVSVGAAPSGQINRVLRSTDGSIWTEHSATEQNSWSSVCWSPELGIFVAVSTNGTNRVMTSPDGITWTARSAAAPLSWQCVAWSPQLGLFAAVASTGTGNRVMTSPDGINWNSRASAADNNWNNLVWSPQLGLFCATSTSGVGNRVMTSPDGINWTVRNTPLDANWTGLAWSSSLGIFLATAASGPVGSLERSMTSLPYLP